MATRQLPLLTFFGRHKRPRNLQTFPPEYTDEEYKGRRAKGQKGGDRS